MIFASTYIFLQNVILLFFYKLRALIYIFMNPWGVVVLELDSHPDHNKGLDYAYCVCTKTHPINQLS